MRRRPPLMFLLGATFFGTSVAMLESYIRERDAEWAILAGWFLLLALGCWLGLYWRHRRGRSEASNDA